MSDSDKVFIARLDRQDEDILPGIWAADYKMFGEDSYSFRDKDVWDRLASSKAGANDMDINGEMLEVMLTKGSLPEAKGAGDWFSLIGELREAATAGVFEGLDTMAAVAASETAMAAVASSETAMAAVAASETAMAAVAASETAMAAVASSETAMAAVASSETAMAAVAASETAMAAVAASETAMAAVAASETAMAAVASSETAKNALWNSPFKRKGEDAIISGNTNVYTSGKGIFLRADSYSSTYILYIDGGNGETLTSNKIYAKAYFTQFRLYYRKSDNTKGFYYIPL